MAASRCCCSGPFNVHFLPEFGTDVTGVNQPGGCRRGRQTFDQGRGFLQGLELLPVPEAQAASIGVVPAQLLMTQSAAEFRVVAMTIGQAPGCCEQLQLIRRGKMFNGRCFEQASIQKTPAQFS